MLPELKKLGVNAGQKILVHRAPKAFTQELRDQAPPETLISTRYTKRAQYDLIFHFAAADENLDALFELMQQKFLRKREAALLHEAFAILMEEPDRKTREAKVRRLFEQVISMVKEV